MGGRDERDQRLTRVRSLGEGRWLTPTIEIVGDMTQGHASAPYEIEIGGSASARVLRPVIDEFTIETTSAGTTRLIGQIVDAAHLNGLLAHFTSLNVELIAVRRLDSPSQPPQPLHPEGPES